MLPSHAGGVQSTISPQPAMRAGVANINTVEDLISKTEDEMIKVRNLGHKSLEEVVHKLAMMGLSLASDENN